jgi:hypothetical protein
MTLKEKFSLILMQFWASDWESQCEQAADEFAIGFAEWHLNLSKSDDWEKFDYNTTEKLLEIYKKEKRL